MPPLLSSLHLAGTEAMERRKAISEIAAEEGDLMPDDWEKLVRRCAKVLAKRMADQDDDRRSERVSAEFFHFQVDRLVWLQLRMPTDFPFDDTFDAVKTRRDEPPYATEYESALLYREEKRKGQPEIILAPQRQDDEHHQPQKDQRTLTSTVASPDPSSHLNLVRGRSRAPSPVSPSHIEDHNIGDQSPAQAESSSHNVPPVEQRRAIWMALFGKEPSVQQGCDAFEVAVPRSWWHMTTDPSRSVISRAQQIVGCVHISLVPLDPDLPEGYLKLVVGLQSSVKSKSPIYNKMVGDVWAAVNKWVLARRLGLELRDLATFLESWVKGDEKEFCPFISDKEEKNDNDQLLLPDAITRKPASLNQVRSDIEKLIMNKTEDDCDEIVDYYFWNLEEPPASCNYHDVVDEISAAWARKVSPSGHQKAQAWAWRSHFALKEE